MNTVKIIEKQQEVCGIIIEMNQAIQFLLINKSFKYKIGSTGNTYNVGAGEAGYDANKVGKDENEVVTPLKQ